VRCAHGFGTGSCGFFGLKSVAFSLAKPLISGLLSQKLKFWESLIIKFLLRSIEMKRKRLVRLVVLLTIFGSLTVAQEEGGYTGPRLEAATVEEAIRIENARPAVLSGIIEYSGFPKID
jgi:hypothetical protein